MEFALVVPLLLAVLFAIIDLGFAINRYTVLNNATREGVRAASLSAEQERGRRVVTDSGCPTSRVRVTVTVSCKTPPGAPAGRGTPTTRPGGIAVVTVTYQHAWLTPIGQGVVVEPDAVQDQPR